ncbi:MAG TPA: hypothetical protein VHC01_12080 [Gaiellaceae bacterium]|jgi:hypothetical protein|nr:hypothetical protein [Gaiellaceae bacterium]
MAMRPNETRERNERIAAAAARHRFDRDVPVPFLCECSDVRCEELLRMRLHDYGEMRSGGDYLVAPGHQVDDGRLVRIRELCWLYEGEVA